MCFCCEVVSELVQFDSEVIVWKAAVRTKNFPFVDVELWNRNRVAVVGSGDFFFEDSNLEFDDVVTFFTSHSLFLKINGLSVRFFGIRSRLEQKFRGPVSNFQSSRSNDGRSTRDEGIRRHALLRRWRRVVRFRFYDERNHQHGRQSNHQSRLRPMFEKKGGCTTQYQEHVPIGYGYYLVCQFDATEKIFRSYTAKSNEEDIGLHFVKSLRDTVLDLWKNL